MSLTEQRTWHLTSIEFSVLLERAGSDRVPFPFSWSTRARTVSDLRAERELARRHVEDSALSAAVSLLSGPGPQLTACGLYLGGSRVRLRAAVRPTRDHAVVVAQDPGPEPDVGGHVHVHVVAASRVGRVVASSMPAHRAGSRSPASARRSELTSEPASHLHDSSGDTDRDRIVALLNGARDGVGEIVVGTCPRGPDGTPGVGPLDVTRGWRWFDATGDGRYLVSVENPASLDDRVSVRPATVHTVAETVDAGLATAGAPRTGAAATGTVPRVGGTRH